MIKLIDLIKEIEQDKLDELGFKDVALGAMMAASTIGAKAGTTSNTPIKQQTTQTSQDSSRTITPVDGIIGSITSQFKFQNPNRTLTTMSAATKGKPSVATTKVTPMGFEEIQKFLNTPISPGQMKEWNAFVDWMKSKSYSGSTKMDHNDFDKDVIAQYKDEVNPNFWINNSDDIKRVQQAHKDYRENTIKTWKIGKMSIELNGEKMVPGKDDVRVDKEYLNLAK